MPPLYSIELSSAVAKQIKKLAAEERKQIMKKIESLAIHPRPMGVKKLVGLENLYRISQGDFRIVYSIQDRHLVVLIVKIGKRKEIYR